MMVDWSTYPFPSRSIFLSDQPRHLLGDIREVVGKGKDILLLELGILALQLESVH
jgi:hypothetical protein